MVTWFNCRVWGNKAEFVAECAKKGSMAFIQRSLEKDTYKNQEDKTVSSTYILVNEIKISSKKMDDKK